MDNNIKATTLGSIHEDIYFDRKVSVSFDTLEYDLDAEYKVLVQIEPPSIQNTVAQIPQHSDKFDLILTWHPNILDQCNNSRLFPFGSCWITDEDRGIHEKTKVLSIISSNKKQTEGHKLRHSIINNKPIPIPMDVYGRGYNPIDNKIVGLKDYMFSLIIENDRTENWFTEKIIDCLVTGTVHLYWGCDNIGDYFDTRGFIQFNTIEEFKVVLESLSEEKYNNMLPFIKNNFKLSLRYTDFWGRVTKTIKEEIKNK